jgi:O-antigen/teichoic acid export membrane protein
MQISKEKTQHWLKLITVTGSAQILVQAVGFISGILVIRLLPVEEYALYTIANTMLGTMTVLSDGGISTGVMAQGGKVWQNKEKLGAILATGLDLRRKFAILSLLVSIPILCYLLLHHGASIITTVLISISLIPAFYAALSDNLLQIPVKLHQAISPLQRNQVGVSIGRLILTGITLFAFPWAFIAIIANGVPRIWGNIRLRKIANGFVSKNAEINIEDKKAILNVVKRILPISIYFAFSGQITVWLISIFGTASSVAQLGAITRLTTILTIISTVISVLIVPRFARLEGRKKILLKYFFQLIFLLLILSGIILVVSYRYSNTFILILGKTYNGLNKEFVISVLGTLIGLISGTIYSINVVRQWLINPIFVIFFNMSLIIVFSILFDMSNLIGVLWFNISVAGIILLLNFSYSIYKMSLLK